MAGTTPNLLLWSYSLSSFQFNATDKGCASFYKAKKDGTLTQVSFPFSSFATSFNFRVGLETVTSRTPSGTYLASGNAYGVSTAPTTGLRTVTLNAPVTVAAGDFYCATVRYDSGTVNSNQYVCDYFNGRDFSSLASHYVSRMTGGVWGAAAVGIPCITPIYDDGDTESCGRQPSIVNAGGASWSSANSPLYRGQGMLMTSTEVCTGVWLWIQPSSTSNFRVSIWKHGDSAALASRTVTISSDWVSASQTVGFVAINPTTCNAGSVYYWIVEPVTTNAITVFPYWDYASLAALRVVNNALFGVTGVAGSPPTWTLYNTGGTGFRHYYICPEFSDMTAGGGYARSEAA